MRAAILVLVASIAAGCGPSERAPDAGAVAQRFHAALAQRDGERACAELIEETRSKLEQRESAPCEEALLALDLPRDGAAAEPSVYVTTASVALGGATTFLDEGPDGWKVSAAGCRPTGPDLPYDCELEG